MNKIEIPNIYNDYYAMSNMISIFANESKGVRSTSLLLYVMHPVFSACMIILLYSEYIAHKDHQCD